MKPNPNATCATCPFLGKPFHAFEDRPLDNQITWYSCGLQGGPCSTEADRVCAGHPDYWMPDGEKRCGNCRNLFEREDGALLTCAVRVFSPLAEARACSQWYPRPDCGE